MANRNEVQGPRFTFLSNKYFTRSFLEIPADGGSTLPQTSIQQVTTQRHKTVSCFKANASLGRHSTHTGWVERLMNVSSSHQYKADPPPSGTCVAAFESRVIKWQLEPILTEGWGQKCSLIGYSGWNESFSSEPTSHFLVSTSSCVTSTQRIGNHCGEMVQFTAS